MKKLLCMLLALVMVLAAMTLVACGGNDDDKKPTDENKEDEKTEITVPDGYTMYDNGDIAFAYPEDWTKSEESGLVMFTSGEAASINITAENKTDLYDDMTAEEFEKMFFPYFEAAGMTATNLKVEHTKNNGMDVMVVTYDMDVSGVSLKQAQYAVTGDEKTYVITVAVEASGDASISQNVLSTLSKVK